ncbi:MAG: hypothetical protein ACR2OB_08065 [Solirubrobacteraceae bacterium]
MTATAFALGSVGAGTAAGAACGALGSLLPGDSSWRALAVIAVLATALLFDATPLRGRLPSSRRQVDEEWLARYRGWVYGVAFGAQLGLGVVTIVTSAAIYATAAVAVLCASPLTGALIGATFGAVRAASLLPARAAREPARLLALHRRLGQLEPVSRGAVAVLELGLLGGVIWALA